MNNTWIFPGGYTERNDPVIFQKCFLFIVVNSGITAQSNSFNVKPVYKSFPFSDADAVGYFMWQTITNKRNVGGCSAHVNDNGVFFFRKASASHNTGRRTAKQCFDGADMGKLFRHKAAIAADNNRCGLYAAFYHGFIYGIQELFYNRNQPGV